MKGRDTQRKPAKKPVTLCYTVPEYVRQKEADIKNTPPGHRFLMYFKGTTKGSGVFWKPVDREKRKALEAVTEIPPSVRVLRDALIERQRRLSEEARAISFTIKTTSPVATGLGNPHPVENGFSFLFPYGLPYLPGSSIKGVLRRAAEEKALFDEDSKWTISLVWLAFGFEEKCAYLSKVESEVEEVRKESTRWFQAFRKYAEIEAEKDGNFKEFLNAISHQIPEAFWGDSRLFCIALQENPNLRKAIHYRGFLNFWDAFFKADSLKVDILNPHHKEYYEGKSTPHDAEQPKPVFFLTIPPGTEFTIFCEVSQKAEEIMPLNEWKDLLQEIVGYASFWLGFGAKTAVGYGVGRIE